MLNIALWYPTSPHLKENGKTLQNKDLSESEENSAQYPNDESLPSNKGGKIDEFYLGYDNDPETEVIAQVVIAPNKSETPEVTTAQRELEKAKAQEQLLKKSKLSATAKVQSKPKGGKSKVAFFVILGLIVLLLAGYFGTMGINSFTEKQEVKKSIEVEKQKDQEKLEAIKATDNPFAVLTGTVAIPSDDPISVKIEANQIKAGASTLIIKDSKLSPINNGCTVEAPTDLCLAAHGQLNKTKFEVFFIKDISRSRFLENPKDFLEFDKTGGTVAATMSLDIAGTEQPAKIGALAGSKASGFVVVFNSEATSENVAEVMKASTVL